MRDDARHPRAIAHFTSDDIRAIANAGRFRDPEDAAYLAGVLIARQHQILARYLTRLSPLADVSAANDQVCATDLARASGALPVERFHYSVVEIAGGRRIALVATLGPQSLICFHPTSLARTELADDARERRVTFVVRNGTSAGPLEIHAYDLGTRGMFIVGLKRPAP